MKAIIFDFDGVLTDTFEFVYKINLDIREEKFTREEYRDFFNGNLFDTPGITEQSDKFYKIQNETFKHLKIDPNIKKNLLTLSKYPLFIISSNMEVTINEFLERNDAEVFKDILGFESHTSKVEKFKTIFKKHNLSADDCIFITDTLGDILEANKVGIKTIAVDFGFHDKKRLEKGHPYKIVSSFKEIVETINLVDSN